MIVVDTNVVANVVLGGAARAAAQEVLRRDPVWAAPRLWRSEFRNVLAVLMRADKLELAGALALLEDAERLLAGRSHPVGSEEVLRLAQASPCTAYDCEFVALARRLGVPLVTSDREILAAFPGLAVSPATFLGSA